MRISTSDFFSQALDQMQSQQVQLAKTQNQVASGKRILNPADDPAGAARSISLQQQLGLSQGYQSNGQAATSALQTEDGVLSSVENVLQRVRELALQANNSALAPTDRQSIVTELKQDLSQLVSLANSTGANGTYLFAGYASQIKPFTELPGGGVTYAGDQGVRHIAIAQGYSIAISDPGSRVFERIPTGNGSFVTAPAAGNTGTGIIDPGSVTDPTAWDGGSYTIDFTSPTQYQVTDASGTVVTSATYTAGAAISFRGITTSIKGAPAAGDQFTVTPSTGQSMFTTVSNLISTVTPTAGATASTQLANGINQSLENLDRALERVQQVRASLGARMNAVDAQTQVDTSTQLTLKSDLSQVNNVDMASAITRLTSESQALQAAQLSFAKIQKLSLFNYL